MGVILDSCIFMAAERRRFRLRDFCAEGLGDQPMGMSAVTLSELHFGVQRADSETRKQARLVQITGWQSDFPVISFDAAAAVLHAEVVARLDGQGKTIGVKDSMIAATALAHDWSVATLNVAEFRRVPGLKVVDASPWLVN